MEHTLSLDNSEVNRSTSGGKAGSLNELNKIGANVPPGFVVTTKCFTDFMEYTKFEDIDSYIKDSHDMESACEDVRDEIKNTTIPDSIQDEFLDTYDSIFSNEDELRVAVRSSATSEDMEDASFAGQQDTYLNVSRGELIQKIRECWASLFTKRACVYRNRQNIGHNEAEMAVIVQKMVDADISGVMFTKNPSTGHDELIIEATWGLGESVVSGEVTPDKYVVNKSDGSIKDTKVSKKTKMIVWNGNSTVTESVCDQKQDEMVLDQQNISELVDRAETISEHYDTAQDVEWAIEDGKLYVLQSRPITSIETDDQKEETNSKEDQDLLDGLGASPGKATGSVKTVDSVEDTDRISEGDVMVTDFTTPDMVPAMERASAVITDEGGMTSHAAIVSRELGVPSVVGTTNSTDVLEDGDYVKVDGDKGSVVLSENSSEDDNNSQQTHSVKQKNPVKNSLTTGTKIKVNVSLPQAAEKASSTGADGVGLLRLEHLVLSLGKTPDKYIQDNGKREFIDEIAGGIGAVAEEFYSRPVRVRTLDAPTDEFRGLEGGSSEPVEDNPMLGYRGIRRSFGTDAFLYQLSAIKKLRKNGYENVEVMFPLVNDSSDVETIVDSMNEVGLDPDSMRWGVMIETPSAALRIDEIVDSGVDFVSFGTNDLTQYTLAVDRNNQRVANRFNESHQSVLDLIEMVIEVCRENNVDTSICGEAASKHNMINHVVRNGITSLSVNIDAVEDTRSKVSQIEKRLILDDIIDN